LSHELLTGDQLHKGDTVSDTLAAGLREEPDWTRIPAEPYFDQTVLSEDPKSARATSATRCHFFGFIFLRKLPAQNRPHSP
jgi:hypothetical protein